VAFACCVFNEKNTIGLKLANLAVAALHPVRAR
jgi:hypothetical protein